MAVPASSIDSQDERGHGDRHLDLEKQAAAPEHEKQRAQPRLVSLLAVEEGVVYKAQPETQSRWYRRLLGVGFEENGIKPVPREDRTNTSYNNLFTVLFTGLLCLLP